MNSFVHGEAENVRKNMIDYVIVDDKLRKNVLHARVYRKLGIHTDHFLVLSRIGSLFIGWRQIFRNHSSTLVRIKVENLQDEKVSDG